MLRFNTTGQKSPFGGHHYPEYGTTFTGDSYDEVVEKLRKFRLHNAIPVGLPDQDILKFYVKNWPWLVRVDFNPKEIPNKDGEYQSWRAWIHKTWKNPPHTLITTTEAKDRWKVCRTCEMNKPLSWKVTDESEELSRRAYLLRRALDVPDGLGYCALHKCDLGAFSFISAAREHSTKKFVIDQPPACWVK